MPNPPKISVVMSAYNTENYVEQAIESILNQTFSDFELIIINDGSSDKTLSILKKFQRKDRRIRVYTNKYNKQIAQSLNNAVGLSHGEFIARMDTDDISEPDRLRQQYQYLLKHKDVAIVGANILIIDKEGKVISSREYPGSSKEMKSLMFRYSPFAHPVVMFRKKVFKEFGGYDEKTVPCEDIDLWFKMGTKYEFGTVTQPLLRYRINYTSNSHSRLKKLELLGFKLKLIAFFRQNYRPSVYDILYNLGQFVTLWVTPSPIRIYIYNLLRSKKII